MSRMDSHIEADVPALIAPSTAIVLPGGGVALVIESAGAVLPTSGTVEDAGAWTALSWAGARGHDALALVPRMPQHEARLEAEGGAARLARPCHLDVTAEPLLRLAAATPRRSAQILGFLRQHLGTDAPGLVAEFLAGAAEPDGFIEVVARTECGGLFLQGWAQTLEAGFAGVAGLGGSDPQKMAVARFEREDILAPASGVCLFAKCVDAATPIPQALYFERDGGIGRLDVLPGLGEPPRDRAATAHVRAMLERIEAPREALGAFRRVCRPRYEGQDSLSGHPGPIAAAFDRVLRAGDGTLLVSGWLLDPLSRVEHVILKSRANLYAPLHRTWHLLPRSDLNAGFAADPRFAGLLDPRDVMHGFIAHAPARPEATEGEVYLELVLDDGSCLFRPVEVTACQGDAILPAILSGLSPDEPELPQIVEGHLAPFLAGIERQAPVLKRIARPTPLGTGVLGRDVDAVMPVSQMAELQPVLAGLAGSRDAALLDLTLVAGRSAAAEMREAIDHAFAFYGLSGQIVVVPDHATLAARLDAGILAGSADHVLLWQPSALPKAAGWLGHLLSEVRRPGRGLVSPALTYEDGSIYFGGARPELAAADTTCARAGFASGGLCDAAPRRVSAGAGEVSLVDRAMLARAGGVSGHLFGDAFMHLDLARRLRGVGAETWCAPAVEFWMLEDPHPDDTAPLARMTRAVDAALIARRTRTEAAT